MELAAITVKKILEMFVILVLGAGIWRYGIVDHETNKRLSGIMLNVVSPCMILMSYQKEFDSRFLAMLMQTLGLSAVSFLIAILIARLVIREKGNPDMAVERMGIIYSNCGFIGIPLIQGILGSDGVFLITAYITVYNIFIWSHGLMLMSGKASGWKNTMKNFLKPSTIAIMVSLVLFVKGIMLPEILAEPLQMIGNMNTPLAMLIAGVNLAESGILAAFKRLSVYWISALRLLVVPVLTLVMLALVHTDRMVGLTVALAAACPAGTMGTMFALQYQKNSNYASEIFAITTLLSLVTLPLVMLVAGLVL